ncbi:oligosaccharide flippase family protein [Alkalihalobacillus macyae]|uniref:oligosaccharide flippase family protein n=1 Tax=Guptibacillus hwajinpoensis TaxID=208199 RepID=UPI00273B114F|nr:oligosaccharide flippase family protein [Alkalihalobacillus macyae]MDP4552608.1 oligosaccharide flippase family protein [Alkalihalobacillus macyae]
MNGKKNSIGLNVIHMFYSTILSSVFNALALIILANYLESRSYGLLSVALAFAMIMSYFTDSGLSEIVLREGSKRKTSIQSVISSYIKIRMLLLGITFIIGFIVIHLTNNNEELIQTAYYLVIPMVMGVAMQGIGTTYFQLVERMQFAGFIRMLSSIFLISTIVIGMAMSLHPYVISFLYGFSYFLAGLCAIILVHRHIKINFKSIFHKGLLFQLWSFLLSGLLFVILPQLGPIILEKTVTLKQVGFFAVAYRIPQALNQLPNVVAGAFFPVLFRYYNHHQLDKHLSLNILQVKIMALIGIGVAIPFYYMSSLIIQLLFGEEWMFAAGLLKVLSLMLIFQSMGIALADGLTSLGRQNKRTLIQSISVLAGIFLYFFMSKSIGVVGASYAGVLIEAIALFGFWLLNPNRSIIARKAIIPYLSYFAVCLIVIEQVLHAYPILAVIVHLLLLLILVFLDKELSHQSMIKLKSFRNSLRKRYVRKSREVGGGF